MTTFGHKLSPEKGEKILTKVAGLLLPDETVFFVCKCSNIRPALDFILVTNFRLFGVASFADKVQVEFPYLTQFTLLADDKRESVAVTGPFGQTVFKVVSRQDHSVLQQTVAEVRSLTTREHVQAAYDAANSLPEAQAMRRTQLAKAGAWPAAKIVGAKLSSKASMAISRQCIGDESPWLILVSSGGAGLLAAWEDRLAIIKTGGLTSYMTGSLGGERAATFHYSDITGIEYNSGMFNGVLEILTPSYSGTANHDFWRGTNQGRNANSGDPWTLSNTLPLTKPEYNASLPQLGELRARIGRAKRTVVEVTVTAPAPTSPAESAIVRSAEMPNDLTKQLTQLAELHRLGVLTADEFAAAKARLLS